MVSNLGNQIWRAYFSNGLVQPPTRWCFRRPFGQRWEATETNQPAPGASRLESAGGLRSGATQVATRSVAQNGATDLSGGRNLPGFFLPNNRVGEGWWVSDLKWVRFEIFFGVKVRSIAIGVIFWHYLCIVKCSPCSWPNLVVERQWGKI